jgi:DNA-directed RNA polymerase sigma subunit (sigma70/sigma32)
MTRKSADRPALHSETGIELAVTREEVARRLGLSVERIGQLERRALAKMRAEAERRGLRLEDLL